MYTTAIFTCAIESHDADSSIPLRVRLTNPSVNVDYFRCTECEDLQYCFFLSYIKCLFFIEKNDLIHTFDDLSDSPLNVLLDVKKNNRIELETPPEKKSKALRSNETGDDLAPFRFSLEVTGLTEEDHENDRAYRRELTIFETFLGYDTRRGRARGTN
ncbi:hypothetical protein TNCT_492281 [Trichonephila clavata]|uniref:Uncharacterized protein n=1 Tax=Trichonephila clavata TaxID=2740835 RepID=A0A8X6FTI3_TRICU|nr:hypothetical protein TNCT_492281 [Trichonephila clavata]